jgi:hypothetical protein
MKSIGQNWRINPNGRARQFLILHGVPGGLIQAVDLNLVNLSAPLDIGQRRTMVIEANRQTQWFTTVRAKIPITPFVYLITSENRFLIARQTAVLLFWSYLLNAMNFPETMHNSRPLWHIPNTEFKNELLIEHTAGRHSQPNMLVLDGLSTNMPPSKISKVHDIVQTICDRPIILLIHGPKPFHYCVDNLGVRPKYLLNIAPSPKRHQV